MSERVVPDSISYLVESMECNLVRYSSEKLGIKVDLAIPREEVTDSVRAVFGERFPQALQLLWLTEQELLQEALTGNSNLNARVTEWERRNPTPKIIRTDIEFLYNADVSNFGVLPEPQPIPMISPDTLEIDGSRIRYILFEFAST